MALIVPSLLSFDLARLGEAVEWIERAGARRIHVDVCDGHFAPGITVGQPVLESLRKATGIELEVHLRVERPERFVGDFATAEAKRVTIHPESTVRLRQALREITRRGSKCGVVLGDSVESLLPILGEVDSVTVFREEAPLDLPQVVGAIRSVATAREQSGSSFEIAVEGALDREALRAAYEAGARAFIPTAPSGSNREAAARVAELMASISAGTGAGRGL